MASWSCNVITVFRTVRQLKIAQCVELGCLRIVDSDIGRTAPWESPILLPHKSIRPIGLNGGSTTNAYSIRACVKKVNMLAADKIRGRARSCRRVIKPAHPKCEGLKHPVLKLLQSTKVQRTLLTALQSISSCIPSCRRHLLSTETISSTPFL